MTEHYPTDPDSLEQQCEVEFFTASGPGGQHRNRSRTGVRLRHLATGIIVTATERRSQHLNLRIAYQRMAMQLQVFQQVRKERKPTKPSRAAKRARMKDKTRRSQTKKTRSRPSAEE